MIIPFSDMEETVTPRFQGGDGEFRARMFNDGLNKVMRARLVPGASIGMHTHTTSSEIVLITKGQGHVLYEGEMIALHEGDCHYCGKGRSHSLINDSDSDLEFFAVVPQQ